MIVIAPVSAQINVVDDVDVARTVRAQLAQQIDASSPRATEDGFTFPEILDGRTNQSSTLREPYGRTTQTLLPNGGWRLNNDSVIYETGWQLVREMDGCYKTTSQKIGSYKFKTNITIVNPPQVVEHDRPILKIERRKVECNGFGDKQS